MKTISLIFFYFESQILAHFESSALLSGTNYFVFKKYNHFLWVVLCFLAKNLTYFVHIFENSTTHLTLMKKKRIPLLAPEKMKAKKTNLKTIWKLMIMQHSLMKRRPDWGTLFEYSLMNMRQLHILFNSAETWQVIVCWFLCFTPNLPELNPETILNIRTKQW